MERHIVLRQYLLEHIFEDTRDVESAVLLAN